MATADLSLHFLGVGAAASPDLGSPSAVLERAGEPLLLIDCGPDTLTRYQAHYGARPRRLFITHTHFDHVAGLEQLFYQSAFAADPQPVQLFVPVPLVAPLHQRVADYPGGVAEGGINFWEVLQIVPVSSGFWLAGLHLHVHPVRHHAPNSAFGLALPGRFFYTGDTRPIPELLHHHAAQGETVFHDCGLHGNPSHSGVDDLLREYQTQLRQRLVLYHYHGAQEATQLRQRGFTVAEPGQRFALDARPDPTVVPLDERRVR